MGGKDGWMVPEVMERRGASGVARWVSLRRSWRVWGVGLGLGVEVGRRVLEVLLLLLKEGVCGEGGVREVIVGWVCDGCCSVMWCFFFFFGKNVVSWGFYWRGW